MEKTTFTETTESARLQELYTWLTANASDLFSEITKDGDDNDLGIICKITDNSSVRFKASEPFTKVTLENGNTYESASNHNFDIGRTAKYGIKTDNGIFVRYYDVDDAECIGNIIVSKANNGSVVASFYYYSRSTYGTIHAICCPEKSVIYDDTTVYSSEMTTFVPIPFGKDCYCDKMLYTPFSQYPKNVVADLQDSSGQHYFYDGYCALKY